MFSQCLSFCLQSASWLLGHCSSLLQCSRYASYWNAFLLPATTKLGQGYVFTHVCDSVHGGVSPGPHPRGRMRGLAGGLSPGPHPGGKLRGLAGGVPRLTSGGWVSTPTPRGVYPSMQWGRPPQQMATVAGSTHPTGMHSCYSCIAPQVDRY